ncbi:LLM class flavin-dependent oxidoreductase [Mycolicibacterium moriokaense]|uniref:Putative F420-dependent oxidoreductase n=1 Tax=Mycolicibacterium moriokaense TaxID=39691 RepID=A0A318HH12_9MYCO|nr:LLM class flavin-dependent oxidoreductase [Mycolicibacterium moriokaense]PXX03282.1 putative F420-dependent oxidoreductase [Mycolicibacterium moriokaense]
MTTLQPSAPAHDTAKTHPRYRAAVTPPQFLGAGSTAQTLDWIRWAESIGFDDVWLPDAGRTDALTLSAVVLAGTQRIRVGIAVVPAYTRTPAVIAATLATLADLAPGRFVLGLGTSSEAMIEGWHGLKLDKPVTRMGETVTLLNSMLAGEKSAFTGETLRSNGYRQPPLTTPVPLYLAALGPRMIELAAATADGVILNLFPLAVTDALVGQIRQAAASAGRSPGDVEICSRFQVMVTDDLPAARNAFRYVFTAYYANPVYNRSLAAAGHGQQAAALLDAAASGDWKRARAALDDDVVDSIAVIGSRQHCQQRVRTYVEAGITTPILFCLSPDPDVQRATYEAFSPAEFTVQP